MGDAAFFGSKRERITYYRTHHCFFRSKKREDAVFLEVKREDVVFLEVKRERIADIWRMLFF